LFLSFLFDDAKLHPFLELQSVFATFFYKNIIIRNSKGCIKNKLLRNRFLIYSTFYALLFLKKGAPFYEKGCTLSGKRMHPKKRILMNVGAVSK